MLHEQGEKREAEKQGAIFLIYKEGKVLLEDRIDPTKVYFGYRLIPGGKFDANRDFTREDTAKNEAKEECGIQITTMVHLDTFLHMTVSNHLYLTSAFLV